MNDKLLDVNRQNICENKGFRLACRYGPLEIKDVYLDINSKDQCRYTLFHLACFYWQLAIVEILLKDARLEINSQNNYVQDSYRFSLVYTIMRTI